MLRSTFYHRLKLSTQVILPRQLSMTVSIFKRSDSEGRKGSTMEDLFKRMEEPEEEPTAKLQDLVKTLKDKDLIQKQKRISLKQMKELDEIRHEKGKEFWFQENTVTNSEEMDEENLEPETEEILTSAPAEDNTGNIEPVKDKAVEVQAIQPQVTALEVNQLKQDIVKRADDRSVSKLMSALIDEIDQDSPAPEETLKSLMAAMNKKASRDVELSEEVTDVRSQLRERRSGGQRFSLTVGPSTNLFSGLSLELPKVETSGPLNLHQRKWLQDLNALLPENIPQNSFEEMMLNIDKQWKFPIDNEQDMGIEDETSFEEHVFLDYLLDEFPETGAVRKFMELVVTGLQQNAHLSVDEKENRIMWFKDYFEKFPAEDISM